jgi:hypothetical protein
MKINFSIIIFLILSVFFYSCDTNNFIDYNVINSTSGTVKVSYNKLLPSNSSTNDTTIFLSPNEQQTIITMSVFASGAYNPEGADTIMMLPTFVVYLNDTIPSTFNLKKTKYWNYHSISKHHGELVLNLYDSLF